MAKKRNPALSLWEYLAGGPKAGGHRYGRHLTPAESARAEKMRKDFAKASAKASVRVKSHTRDGAKVKSYVRTRPRSERGTMLGELIKAGFSPYAARKAVRGGAHYTKGSR